MRAGASPASLWLRAGALCPACFGDRLPAGTPSAPGHGWHLLGAGCTGNIKRAGDGSDGAQRKGITGEEKPRMCGILFLAVALMPPRWRMFVSVPAVGEIRASCEAPSAHPSLRASQVEIPGSCRTPGALSQEKDKAPARSRIALPAAANPQSSAPAQHLHPALIGFFNKVKISVTIWFLHCPV